MPHRHHRSRPRVLVLFGLLVATLLGLATPAHATDDELVDAYRSAFGPPGLAAAVIDGSGVQTILRGTDGNGRPVTGRTRFRLASLSKSITATAVMLLVDRGRFTLDDPVVKVLPEFRLADPRYPAITVRQLLSHTSGLSVSTNDEYALPPPRTAQDVVARLADKRLAYGPGTTHDYHNTNFSVAARIVEVVSGVSFEEFLQRELFGPLGMTDTSTTLLCDDAAPGLATGHVVIAGLAIPAPEMPGSCVGNGGVISTLDDMVRWLRFHQGTLGSDLLSASALVELHRPQPAGRGYALGWQERPVFEGGPPTLVAHGGSLATWTTDMAFDPATGQGVVVLTNGASGAPGLLTVNLFAARTGAPASPMSNPLNAISLVLLGLTLVATGLLVATIIRAPRWAARRRSSPRPRVVLRLVPLAVVTVAGLFLPALIGIQGGAFNLQYWVVVAWLLPPLALFSSVCLLLGAVALARRLWCWSRTRRAAARVR